MWCGLCFNTTRIKKTRRRTEDLTRFLTGYILADLDGMDYFAICIIVLLVLGAVLNGAVMVRKWCYDGKHVTPLRLTILGSCLTLLLTSTFPHALYLECITIPADEVYPGNRHALATFRFLSQRTLQPLTSFFIASAVTAELLELTSYRSAKKMRMTIGLLFASLAYVVAVILPVSLWGYMHSVAQPCERGYLPSGAAEPESIRAVSAVIYCLPYLSVILALSALVAFYFTKRRTRNSNKWIPAYPQTAETLKTANSTGITKDRDVESYHDCSEKSLILPRHEPSGTSFPSVTFVVGVIQVTSGISAFVQFLLPAGKQVDAGFMVHSTVLFLAPVLIPCVWFAHPDL